MMFMETIRIKGTALEVLRIAAPPGAVASAASTASTATIVFLHEGLGSVAMWRDWPAQVCAASGRAGIVYSRQGYGGSERLDNPRGAPVELRGRRAGRLLPDYMHREAWEVLPELLQRQGIRAPVLLGHSDGGSIALLHASRHPVSACIVMAPHVVVEDVSVQAITQARKAFEQGDLRERLKRYHADVDGAFWQWNDIWLSSAFRNFDIRGDCRRIEAPVLALQGVDDPYGSMAQIELIAPRGPIELHKLAHCGHSPHRDQPALALQLACDFMRERS